MASDLNNPECAPTVTSFADEEIEEGQEVSNDEDFSKEREKSENRSHLSKAGLNVQCKHLTKSQNSSRSRSLSRSPSRRRRRSRSTSKLRRHKRRRRSSERKKERSRKKRSRSKSPKNGRSRHRSKSKSKSHSRSCSRSPESKRDSRSPLRSRGRCRRSSSSESCSRSGSRSRFRSRSFWGSRSRSGIIIRDHRRGARPFHVYRQPNRKPYSRYQYRSGSVTRSSSSSRSRSRSSSRSRPRRKRRSSRGSRSSSRHRNRSHPRHRRRSLTRSKSNSPPRTKGGLKGHELQTKTKESKISTSTETLCKSPTKNLPSYQEKSFSAPSQENENSLRSLRPGDIKNQSKAATQNFIASMLGDGKTGKLVPLEQNEFKFEPPSGPASTLTHGFVSTFREEDKGHDSGKDDSTKGDSNNSFHVDAALEKAKRQLLEKARKKKEQVPNDAESDTVSVSNVKILKDAKVIIGKMKIPNKKQNPNRSVTEMKRDFNWYEQYYSNYYSFDPYTAAYYAQYAMVTCGDYSKSSVSGWLESYGVSYDEKNTSNMQLIPPTAGQQVASDQLDESTALAKQDQHSSGGEVNEQETSDAQANKIQVITPNVPPAANEVYFMNCDVNASESCDEDMDMDSDQEKCQSPPVQPPPPSPPMVTSLLVDENVYLPNGLEVPSGTKEVIVHPYPQAHPLATQFTAEQIHTTLESLETLSASN